MNFPRRFFLTVLALAVCAQAADITVTLDTANLRLRKDGPIPLEVRFQNATPRILEGRLELTLLFGDRKAGVHRTADIVLQPGTRTVPVLLPPPPEAHPGDGIAARIRWFGTDGTRDLGEQGIGIYGTGTNEVVTGIVRTERRLTEIDHAREASLKVESLRPKLDAEGWLSFTTQMAPIAGGSLPVHPAGLCAYDAVFLDGPAFAAVNGKQLAALARWVEAGGSVGVCADGRLEDRHIAFLNRLGGSENPVTPFALNPDGVLTRGTPAKPGADPRTDAAKRNPILLRPGLGRAFVASDSGSTEKAFDRNEWRAAVAWLWKFRDSEQREVARTGSWSKGFVSEHRSWRGGPDASELPTVWSAAAGFNALTPGAPRQMPFSLIALVLGVLLVATGPADWFALGWIRRRRWTWIAFPIACAACAWWTAHLAGKYLGIADRTGSVRFVDLADDGRPLREVRFEMMLPARDRDWTFDVRDAVAVPIPRESARLRLTAANLAAAASGDTASTSEWPSPTHFILRRTLRQWSPAMARITSFGETVDEAQPDWDAAFAHFRGDANAEKWPSDDAVHGGFYFDVPKRGGSDDGYNLGNFLRDPELVASGGADDVFVRWLAFGNDTRTLGGLATATSPLLAGTSDLIRQRDQSPGRRVLCAWRRAGGELLIYRRSFPVK